MAAEIAVQNPTPAPNFKATPIIRDRLIPASAERCKIIFDPAKHLSFSEYPRTHTLQDLSLPEDAGISPIAVSEPFPLFTEEAIRIMRSEIFTSEVFDKCFISSSFASAQLRGHCPRYAPFMNDAWKSPAVQAIVNRIAGIELVPMYDMEIGNINISVQDPEDARAKLDETNNPDEEFPVTKWHRDSYPFVCVVMLSDTAGMVGGETALKTGTGAVLKVRGPQMGSAVILQGQCITHQALAAIGGTERITMITSYRPRDAFVPDRSNLFTIRQLTEHSELYFQWTEYRVEVLQERLRAMLKVMEQEHRGDRKTDIGRIRSFLKEQEEWLAMTREEIHDYV